MTTLHTYDEVALLQSLAHMSPDKRLLFALACAERMIAASESLQMDHQKVRLTKARGYLDALWSTYSSPRQRPDLEAACDSLIPAEDEMSDQRDPFVEDAVAALAYAAACASKGDAQSAAYAARRAYSGVDHAVEVLEASISDEVALRQHPVIQTELRNQARDLVDVESEEANMIRERAYRAGRDMFVPAVR